MRPTLYTLAALVLVSGCSALPALLADIPAGVSAVEQVIAAARAQGRDVAPDVLARAKAIDDAAAKRDAAAKARDKATAASLASLQAAERAEKLQIAALVAAVSKPPPACPACVACAPDAGAWRPEVVAGPWDGGAEGGR